MRPLADACIYTILHPDKLAEAASLRGPSTFVVKRRMVTAESLFRDTEAGQHVAVLFGDSTDCSRLIYWGLLTAIDIGISDTHYTVFPVRGLKSGHSPQELILQSTGEPIVADFIRPYAICRIPKFLARKS